METPTNQVVDIEHIDMPWVTSSYKSERIWSEPTQPENCASVAISEL